MSPKDPKQGQKKYTSELRSILRKKQQSEIEEVRKKLLFRNRVLDLLQKHNGKETAKIMGVHPMVIYRIRDGRTYTNLENLSITVASLKLKRNSEVKTCISCGRECKLFSTVTFKCVECYLLCLDTTGTIKIMTDKEFAKRNQ